MKIGILTFHRAINYGAVLQCYALQETLKSLGHDVEVVDYRVLFVEHFRKFVSCEAFLQQKSIVRKIVYLISCLANIKPTLTSIASFDSFLNSKLKISKQIYTPQNINQADYDMFVVGSDQVWNITFAKGFDPLFWGDCISTKRIISYAAIIGASKEIPEEQIPSIIQRLENFQNVSVRELDFQQWLLWKCNYNATLVLDPTLLINKDIYDRIAIKPQFNRFVLVYALENVDGIFNFANFIAKRLGCTVIRVMAKHSQIRKQPYKIVSSVKPEEFLGYFKYADFTIVASFHGTVFSLMFQKDFYVAQSPHDNRARGLLTKIGLEDRLVDVKNQLEPSCIKYSGIEDKLAQLRSESLGFLSKSLKES